MMTSFLQKRFHQIIPKKTLIVLSLAFFLVLPALGWSIDEDRPFTVVLPESPVLLQPGQREIGLEFLIAIPEGYFLYRNKTEIEFETLAGAQWLKTNLPPGKIKDDPFFNRPEEIWEHEVAILTTLQLPQNITMPLHITGTLRYQGCSSKLCYKPMREKFTLTLLPATTTTPATTSGVNGQAQNNQLSWLTKLLQKGGVWLYLAALLGGMLTDLTPCVWPLIPLTLAVIGVRRQASFKINFSHSLILVLGISLTHALLGLIAGLLGKQVGFLFQSPLFLTLMSLLFFAMALAMFGVWNFALPASWLNMASRIQPHGAVGIFLVGATLGLMAAPCVGPILAPLLVLIAQNTTPSQGTLILFFYGLGISTLFFIFGISQHWIQRRLHGGRFNILAKYFLGLSLLGLAVYYGWIVFESQRPRPQNHRTAIAWESEPKQALDRSQREGKPVFVDFFAQWCVPCLEIEKTIFSDTELVRKINHAFIPLQFDCTLENPLCDEVTEKYQVVGWPTMLFLDCQGSVLENHRLVGIVPTGTEMNTHLSAVLAETQDTCQLEVP